MIIVEQECLAPDSPLDEYGRPTQYPQFLHVLYRDVDLEIDNNNTTTTTEQMAEKANEASSKVRKILAVELLIWILDKLDFRSPIVYFFLDCCFAIFDLEFLFYFLLIF